jgi:catechol 2,3-dioxygenase-like lactoylglutathione lyase family enzyme
MSASARKRRTAGKRATATRKRRAAAVKAVATRRARTAATARRRGPGLNACDIVAFVATADGARARDFYGSVMGLRLVADEPFALVFDANGVMLRVQKVEAVRPVAYTTVGWSVADIATTVRGLSAKGVVFERYPGLSHDDLGVWTSPNGGRVAWFKDPDGNILSLTQF